MTWVIINSSRILNGMAAQASLEVDALWLSASALKGNVFYEVSARSINPPQSQWAADVANGL
jgi:hypothetical protein